LPEKALAAPALPSRAASGEAALRSVLS
jgi:hypothetical protein